MNQRIMESTHSGGAKSSMFPCMTVGMDELKFVEQERSQCVNGFEGNTDIEHANSQYVICPF